MARHFLVLSNVLQQNARMASVANVTIHPSQFPEAVRRDLRESLRARRVNHKFHYDSFKQTQKWLALHEAYSPARTDADCAGIYDQGFVVAAERIAAKEVHLIGLGCGGGQKDTRLLHLLRQAGKGVAYTPSDVSVAMVLVARAAAMAEVAGADCRPLVCDLATADDLPAVLDGQPASRMPRLLTFFGMIPNFEPQIILPRLASLVRAEDHLLFSANLAPGPDYAAGVAHILPLYDNALTRDWLMTFLLDLGMENADGELRFGVEDDPAGSGLKRVAAYFHFTRARQIEMDGEIFKFSSGEKIRLFFSYRHTPDRVRALLEEHGLRVVEQWVAKSGEEGVFLCRKYPSTQ
jgi:L-histidine N-alpha-methyltransferase